MKYTAKISIHYFIEAEDRQGARDIAAAATLAVESAIKPLIPTFRLIRGYYYEEPERDIDTDAWAQTVKDFSEGGIHGRQERKQNPN